MIKLSIRLHILVHLITALFVGALFFYFYPSYLVFIVALLGGFLIDTDHLFDYFMAFGWGFDLKVFASDLPFIKSLKTYVLFHSWELVVVLLVAGALVKYKMIHYTVLCLGCAIMIHLIVDQFVNGVNWKAYFITYRIKNNFNSQAVAMEDHWKETLEKRELIYK